MTGKNSSGSAALHGAQAIIITASMVKARDSMEF
jgi:hypothetical protein